MTHLMDCEIQMHALRLLREGVRPKDLLQALREELPGLPEDRLSSVYRETVLYLLKNPSLTQGPQ